MASLLLTISALVLICAILLKSISDLQRKRNATLAARTALYGHVERRRKIIAASTLPELLKSEAVSFVTATIPAEAAELAQEEARLERLLEALASRISDAQKYELAEAGAKIERAAAHYNKCVNAYNSGLRSIPAAFFARILKFTSFDIF